MEALSNRDGKTPSNHQISKAIASTTHDQLHKNATNCKEMIMNAVKRSLVCYVAVRPRLSAFLEPNIGRPICQSAFDRTSANVNIFSSRSMVTAAVGDDGQHTNNKEEEAPEPFVFPRWIRLKGMANVESRHEVTNQVSDCISASGGFLINFNMLSDMVTVMTVEEVMPPRIELFLERMAQVPGFHLDDDSQQLLQECVDAVHAGASSSADNDNGSSITIPPAVYANLQITWLGAQGKLQQNIVADG